MKAQAPALAELWATRRWAEGHAGVVHGVWAVADRQLAYRATVPARTRRLSRDAGRDGLVGWGRARDFAALAEAPLRVMILKIGMESSRDIKPIAIMLDSPRAAAERLRADAEDDDSSSPA